ncbi:EAL domain-containing protein [Thalassotalea piscium]
MKHLFQSLQSRLMLLILLVALPGLSGLIYVAYLERENAINSSFEQAMNTVELTSAFQTHLIKRTESFLQHLSVFNEVADPNSAQCSAFLADILKISDLYVNIGVPRVDGKLLCNAKPLTAPINVADRAYFKKAIATRGFSIGEFQLDRASGVTSINFAYPIIPANSENIVAVAVAVISLDWWSKQLSQSHLPPNSVAYITDHDNNIIAAYPKKDELLGINLNNTHSDLKLYNSAFQHSDVNLISHDDNLRIFVSQPLFEDNDLIKINVGIPFDEKLSAINERLIKTGLILIVIIFLLFLFATWGIKKSILNPLKVLTQSTKDLQLGLTVDDVPKHGSSELIELQQRFIVMAKTRLNAEHQLEKSQRSLQESEVRLYKHIENTPLGCISWDKNFTCTAWNKSAEKIFGYSAEEAIGIHGSDLIITADMRTQMTNVYQQLLDDKGGKRSTNENLTKNGKTIVCEWHNTLIHDQNGVPIGVTSLVQDITHSKELKEQLTLAASVFSHAREGIIITDIKGSIIDVNDSFINITGYEREEVLGNNPSMLKSDRQSPDFYENLWQSINDNGYWYGEIWNKRKNNEVYAQLLTITAVYDDEGIIKNYIAIFSDISEIKEQQFKLEHMAHYDVLTNLPNRTLLAGRLNKAITQSDSTHNQLAVVFLDLDGFKEVNDSLGHSFGDELLVTLSRRLKDTLRDCDTLSRFGGDEFVAVLANLEQIQDYQYIVERMLKVVAEPVTLGDDLITISASIGVTLFPLDNTDADQLIRHADQAMYVAKQKGKNCYHLFDIESEDAIKQRHENLQNISKALDNREFVLYYQPKVNLNTGDIIGAEALIRWQHPQRGLLSPIEFLPLIENHQLSIDVGEWVLEESLNQLRQWQQAGLKLKVSVNIAALQIQQEDFANKLEAILSVYPDVSPRYLQLEVLETSELSDLNMASETMLKCVKLGVSFAIDDFGTGYSSLTYLRRLPADLIKIDQTFVRDMLFDPDDRAIVVGIIALAKSFNRTVIAEGVETIAHASTLLNLGCELAQGYGIAKPMPANEIPQWTSYWKTNKEWQQLR